MIRTLPAALALVLVGSLPSTADEKPAARTLARTLRIVADSILKQDWKALEAVGPTVEDVKTLESAFAQATYLRDQAEHLGGLRGFIEKHGGYAGAAAQQRRDLVARTTASRGRVLSDVDWSTVTWSRYLPIRRNAIRSRPFEVRMESFALKDAHRELVFEGPVMRAASGWIGMAGFEFRETIPVSSRVDEPNATTHPFAGLWTGIEGGPLQRDVTLWLQPMEQQHKYLARFLLTQETPRGTSVTASRISGMTAGSRAQGGPRLQWSDGFLVHEDGVLQGRLTEHAVALRPVALDKPPPALDRKIELTLQGIVAVSTPLLAQVRRSSFRLDMKPGGTGAIDVAIRARKPGDPDVGPWVAATLTARHTGGSIVSATGKAPYFALIRHRHAVMVRLIWWERNRFGPTPTIVHAYAPFE